MKTTATFKPGLSCNRVFLIFFILICASCSTMHVVDLRPDQRNCLSLPALDPVFDMVSLESMYPGINSPNPRAQDALTLFEREVKDCITNPYGESRGIIFCRIAYGEKRFKSYFLSAILFHVPSLLGVPLAQANTFIDLDVEIYTSNNRLIARYNGIGYDKSYSGIYYGYKMSSLSRISGIKAFKMAFNDIKQQIAIDHEKLLIELIINEH
jgi:hypothetical protein